MTAMPAGISIVHVERLHLTLASTAWTFALQRRAAIDAHFAALRRAQPAFWNGRVLLLREYALADGVFRGVYLETDYASLLAWRDWGFPDAATWDCFGSAAIATSDGAFLLGVMSAHTANAGRIYFPCGTPDPSDVVNGCVDLDHNVRRELKEETGLAIEDFAAGPGWISVIGKSLITHIKVLRSDQDAATLRGRISAHLASERRPELADIRIVRGEADLDSMMQPYIVGFLQYAWAGGLGATLGATLGTTT